MLFGMGTVFVFLTLLVIGTKTMSMLITRYLAEEPEPVPVPSRGIQAAPSVDSRTLAIIQAAVQAHRAKHRQ